MTASVADLVPVAATLLDRLRGSGHTLATAESLTGGALAAAIVTIRVLLRAAWHRYRWNTRPRSPRIR